MDAIRLDFGCGQHCKKGFEGVDISLKLPIKYQINLLKFPLPWEDSIVDEIWCSHFIEHIPAREVQLTDLYKLPFSPPSKLGDIPETPPICPDMLGQDMFFAFFDECWRILKPKGKITLIWPALQTNRAFKDPTHRRFIPLETFPYLSVNGRKSMGLSHYHVKCNFEKISCNEILPKSWTDGVNYQITLQTLR